jgi:hypothetical protein
VKYLIFIILLVSACERDMGEMGAADAAPQPIDANTTAEEQWQIWRGFSEELNAYSTEQGLGGDWYWWVKIRASSLSGEDPRTNRFFFPYTRARMPGGKTVQVLVQYQPGREGFYSPPFEGGETEHLQLLEELLNLWYKGWTFNLHPTGEISSEEGGSRRRPGVAQRRHFVLRWYENRTSRVRDGNRPRESALALVLASLLRCPLGRPVPVHRAPPRRRGVRNGPSERDGQRGAIHVANSGIFGGRTCSHERNHLRAAAALPAAQGRR